MTTTITVPNPHGTNDRLRLDVDPFDGITVTSEAPGRPTWYQPCDSIGEALAVIADEVVRISAERFGTETSE